MKTLRIAVAAVLTAIGLTVAPTAAFAGQINATGATITWDDNSLFQPAKFSCSTFKFNVTMDSSIWQVQLSITNKFGDLVSGRGSIYGNGQVSLQVCSDRDLTGTKLVAEVITHRVVTSIYEQPIVFQARPTVASPSATPSTTKPSTSRKFKNCSELRVQYPGGVSRSAKWVNKGAKLKQRPTLNPQIYALYKSWDTDKDGLVCER